MRGVSSQDISAALTLARRGADALSREELAQAVRGCAAGLERLHPGKTLELRIPPYAAVQLGSAERGAHTRGTPPNVIETDPATFLALASGQLTWADALSAHRVHASGPHADLAGWLPLSVDSQRV